MSSIEGKIEKLVETKITNLGYELYDVEYAKEGKDYFLRIFIDSEKGIDLNDCEKVNDAISDLLDKADYIKEQYFLEVSSSGVERTLRKDKHLNKYLNEEIQINLFKSIEKNKQLQGILKEFNEEQIILQIDEKEIQIPRKNISLIKTVYNWN